MGSHEHSRAVIVVHDLANSFYKKQAFKARGSDSANDTIRIKFNTKIGRYPVMSFMVMGFKERNLGTMENPYDGSFSKIGEIEI